MSKLAQLRTAFTKNRVALGALGAVAVAALAWQARTSKGAVTAGTDVQQPAGTSTAPSYYTGGTAYDSTVTDLYNAIQPQLEELRDIASKIPVPGTPTTPDVSPTPTVSPYDQELASRRTSISQWYRDFLGREAGAGEVEFWNHASPDMNAIRNAIATSPEAANRR